MTTEKLKQILDKQKIVRYRDDFIKAMTEAVNMAIDECAESVDLEVNHFYRADWHKEYEERFIESDTCFVVVNKQSIIKNKIK